MISLSAQEMAEAMGARIVAAGGDSRPERAVVDSREAGPGDLFFGLRGASADGGEFAGQALGAGAWGAVVGGEGDGLPGGWVFAVEDPLLALGALARAWRRRLGAGVVGITGSVGKTTVKDIAKALLPGRVHANQENLNTEIGLPLTVLAAPPETDVLVLEMAMRGAGQIAELAEIAEPDVGVITNVGPVHVELLGSIEAIAAAKAELLAGLGPEGTAVVPADPGPLAPHLDPSRRALTFGEGGDVAARGTTVEDGVTEAAVVTPAGDHVFHFPFTEAHNVTNALAAIAAGLALGADIGEMADRAPDIGFSRFRGERVELPGGILLVNDCYNANPVSMRAALDHLATLGAARRIAVLGVMAELGSEAPSYHREVGAHAREAGVDVVIGVGEPSRDYDPDQLVATPEDAAELLAAQLGAEDAVLVKGSRSAGLEAVAEELEELLADG
ncbi:MAG TPA: UDP-N-acetylmuramoyl-tripeptide--D-alanyl-D-alanine ligase [Solirubrobacterales bacterium]|nr:UDP-N-acetylmuramoyl-tripeptide--D-alanyl-D-alanine ligase [Solirubrobacterales bacterium]